MSRKKLISSLLVSLMFLVALAGCGKKSNDKEVNEGAAGDGELKGEIVFWHSFTQGPRKDYMQNVADEFMKEHKDVKITIETFAWPEFYTKWTTGLTAGQVPDISSALPTHVVEMIDADAIIPLNDVIDDIGRDRFYEAALREGTVGEDNYSLPLYTHAQVMWYRKDLLEEANIEVPETWDELFEAAVKISETTDKYGLSVPMGSTDMMATRFLNYYVRSAGETLLTEDGKANLTSDVAIEGINYWVEMYKETSPEGSVNYDVLDQANLFYHGNTAFDFNSGFHIGGVEANSPHLLDHIDAAPIPKINKDDEKQGIETSNTPMVVWKNSKHPEIAKEFLKKLYDKEEYIKFLHSVPAGMLPALKDIEDEPAYLDNETLEKFDNAAKVIALEVSEGTAIGMEYGPKVEAGILTSQAIIENMFQEIVVSNKPIQKAAEDAERELNEIFKTY